FASEPLGSSLSAVCCGVVHRPDLGPPVQPPGNPGRPQSTSAVGVETETAVGSGSRAHSWSLSAPDADRFHHGTAAEHRGPRAGPGPSCVCVRVALTFALSGGPAMRSNFSRRVARLARSLWRRPAARPAYRPALECLEDRALPSTLGVVNPGPSLTPRATSATSAAASAVLVHP